jgi:ferredoxin-NADP reductase
MIRLLRRDAVARDTIKLTFEKPAGFSFKAGQAVDLTLPEPPETDAKGNRRAFSLVSAPHEPGLVVATRARDTAFKRVLRGLEPGARLQLEGPFGSLTLHGNGARPAVFIAGGIGITPFMSIIKQALHDHLPHRMTLLYSNRRPEDAAFLGDLLGLQQQHAGQLTVIPTMTASEGTAWGGRTGVIDAALLRSVSASAMQPVYYVVGPPGLVAGMRAVLADVGVDDDDIRTEDFAGY